MILKDEGKRCSLGNNQSLTQLLNGKKEKETLERPTQIDETVKNVSSIFMVSGLPYSKID